MSDQEVLMGVTLCRGPWSHDPPGDDMPVEEVAKKAFRMARDSNYTWFTRNDDVRFRIGVGLLLMHYKGSPVYSQIQGTLTALKSLNAMMNGVPVDLGAVFDEDTETLPLLPWYKETAEAAC